MPLATTVRAAVPPDGIVCDCGCVVIEGETGPPLLLLRGLGVPAVKSALLLSVSVAPLLARRSAVVVLGAGAGELSEQLAVEPKPTKSMIALLDGQAPESAVVLLTRATLPAVALIAIVPVVSGVGMALTPLAPKPSAIR